MYDSFDHHGFGSNESSIPRSAKTQDTGHSTHNPEINHGGFRPAVEVIWAATTISKYRRR
jgi:hypothetical protein